MKIYLAGTPGMRERERGSGSVFIKEGCLVFGI
jgi:hypothetical protein